jgi:acetyl-CoA carboxylase carboxyltransferase component
MSAEASVNAVYANKIAAIADEDERARYVAARTAEQRADLNLLRMASDLVVDAVVDPGSLRAELAARMVDADRWTRSSGRRHHLISPV